MSPARTARSVATLALLALLATLALVTWRVPVRRSLVPLELDHVVREKQLRREKHPGRDDVRVLLLDEGGAARVLRVEQQVFDAVKDGQRLRKPAGSTRLAIGDRVVELAPSVEASELARVLPIVVAGPLLALAWRLAGSRRAPQAG